MLDLLQNSPWSVREAMLKRFREETEFWGFGLEQPVTTISDETNTGDGLCGTLNNTGTDITNKPLETSTPIQPNKETELT